MRHRTKSNAAPLQLPSNVETYSREVEQIARKLAQTRGSTAADRKALAAAVTRDAERVFDVIVSTTIRAPR